MTPMVYGHSIIHTESLLVIDMLNNASLPKRFRTIVEITKNKKINPTGLENLHLIGSGQFSQKSLERIIKKFPQQKITVFDLRQENHFFINGDAVSLYSPRNAANANKTDKQIDAKEKLIINRLQKKDQIRVFQIVTKTDGIIKKVKPVDYEKTTILSEKELLKKYDVTYRRLHVRDFYRPDNQSVDRFLEMFKTIPKNGLIYFHCRGGSGRTTTFMSMVDMLKNAKNVSFNDILTRQKLLGGKDLQKIPPKGTYKHASANERLIFLKLFYEYARNRNDQPGLSWQEWLRGKINTYKT